MRNELLSLALAAAIGAVAAAQSKVFVVSPAGPLTSVQSAVSAAADGDTILVKTGNYSGFTIDDKRVNIVADNGAGVVISGTVRAQNLASTRCVVLIGLRVQGTSGGAFGSGDALDLVNDSGSIRVEGCTLRAATAFPSGAGAHVDTCADVCFTRCSMFGGPSWGAPGVGSGLDMHNSKVAVYECAVTGGAGLNGGCNCQGYPAGDGVSSSSASFLFASGSSFTGGRGGNAQSGCLGCGCGADGGAGGDGLDALAPSVVKLLACTFVGGQGGSAVNGGCGSYVFNPGAPGLGVNALSVTYLTGSTRSLTVDNPVRELASFTLTATGNPGDNVFVWVTPATKFRWVPTYLGVQLNLVTGAPHFLGTIGASGSLSRTSAWRDLGPGIECRNLFLQAAMRDATGSFTFSSAVSMVVLDQAF